jgi:hypothetical protein
MRIRTVCQTEWRRGQSNGSSTGSIRQIPPSVYWARITQSHQRINQDRTAGHRVVMSRDVTFNAEILHHERNVIQRPIWTGPTARVRSDKGKIQKFAVWVKKKALINVLHPRVNCSAENITRYRYIRNWADKRAQWSFSMIFIFTFYKQEFFFFRKKTKKKCI